MSIRYVPSTHEHADYLALNLRAGDLEELHASGLLEPEDIQMAVRMPLLLDGETATLLVDGVPAAMFGVVKSGEGVGVPWLLGTTVLDQNKRLLLTDAKVVVQNMMNQFEVLENLIFEGSKTNRRWLKWLGFSEDEPIPHPVTGEPFIRFHWRKK